MGDEVKASEALVEKGRIEMRALQGEEKHQDDWRHRPGNRSKACAGQGQGERAGRKGESA